MTNPFAYGGVVGNGEFCNRTRELTDLTEVMKSGGRCFVYAERRMGKTSLVRRALENLPRNKFLPVYVDLWPTDGSVAFATAMACAVTMAVETKTTKLLEVGKSLFGRLRPSVMLDDSGQPKVEFGMQGHSLSKPDLTEVLAAVHRKKICGCKEVDRQAADHRVMRSNPGASVLYPTFVSRFMVDGRAGRAG